MAAALAAARPGADAPSPDFVARLQQRLADANQAAETTAVETTGTRPGWLWLSRRRLLARFAPQAAAVALGAAAATAAHSLMDRLSTDQDDSELVPATGGRWVPVASLASLASLPPGTPVRFSAGAIEGFVILLQTPKEEVRAVSAVCTHLGCILAASPGGDRLECPCHGAAFATDGSPLSAEYQRPLPKLRTRLSGDQVEVFAT
jgi:Rieske Fe-S protein